MHTEGVRRVNVDFSLEPLNKFRAKLSNFTSRIGPALDKNKELFTTRLLEETKKNASGRPGPNIVTGHYYNAFMILDGKVVNMSPQARRLEYGFVGTDSLGRQYHQPAFPHFRPALATVSQEFRGSLGRIIIMTWRTS